MSEGVGIQVKNLVKDYPQQKGPPLRAVNSLNMEFKKGCITGMYVYVWACVVAAVVVSEAVVCVCVWTAFLGHNGAVRVGGWV
jgi:hypothetical protein